MTFYFFYFYFFIKAETCAYSIVRGDTCSVKVMNFVLFGELTILTIRANQNRIVFMVGFFKDKVGKTSRFLHAGRTCSLRCLSAKSAITKKNSLTELRT